MLNDVEQMAARAIENNTYEVLILTPDGGKVWLNASAELVEKEPGMVWPIWMRKLTEALASMRD